MCARYQHCERMCSSGEGSRRTLGRLQGAFCFVRSNASARSPCAQAGGALLRPGALALALPKAAFRPPWAAFVDAGLPRALLDGVIDRLPWRGLVAAASPGEHVSGTRPRRAPQARAFMHVFRFMLAEYALT